MNLKLLGMTHALSAKADAEVSAISLRTPLSGPAEALPSKVGSLLEVVELEHTLVVEIADVFEKLPAPAEPKTLQERVQAARVALRRARSRGDVTRVELQRATLRAFKTELEAG